MTDPTPARVAPPLNRAAAPAPLGYVARVVIAVAIVAVAWFALQLREVFAIAFGSIVAAAALRTIAAPLQRHAGLGEQSSLAVVVVGLLVGTTLGLWWLGAPVAAQFEALREALPRALDTAMTWLRHHDLGVAALQAWDDASPNIAWGRLAGAAGSTLGAIGSLALMAIAGIYLAADPRTYRNGALRLLPPAHRARAGEAIDLAAERLSRWLLSQGLAMLAVGVSTGAGLALLGLPLAIPLGVIAGLLEFIPFFGTMVAATLIVLLAFAQGVTPAFHAALLCLAIQQLEGNVLQPVLQRWAMALPPALGLIAVIVFGVLFGPLGVVFATPLLVVLMVFVQHLYIDGTIESGDAPG